MTNKDIEKEYCKEISTYAEITIDDNRTDGDRLLASMMAALIYNGKVNKNRFDNLLKEGLKILEEMHGLPLHRIYRASYTLTG